VSETAAAGPRFTLYTRAGCHLCEALAAALAALAPGHAVEHIDVDRDPELKRRYGLDVPVLFGGGEELCRHRLDGEAVTSWLHRQPGGIPGGSRS
jgi:hypothetical protein